MEYYNAKALNQDGYFIFNEEHKVYNVNKKRIKSGLNPAYLRHNRLGHKNKKHIKELHSDGLL